MTVTTTTILPADRTAATSETVTVDAGAVVTIGIATAGDDAGEQNLPDKPFPVKMVNTGGDDMTLDVLGKGKTSYAVVGPAEVVIERPLLDAGEPEVLGYKKV